MKYRLCLVTLLTLALGVLTQALAQPPADDLDDLMEKAIKAALKKVGPSVVAIETSGGTDLVVTGPRGAPIRRGTGPTSGLIVSEDGYIISSAFNFANKPTSIFVAVPGQKERFVAKVISTDHTRMLTLLKVDTKGLPVQTAVPKAEIRVGQTGLAVGRTLAVDVEGPPSVSVGIVSAIERIWGKCIQSDAKVSPTNYGGPLVDIQGRILGVLVPASPRAEGETAGFEWYDSGIGFAIPLEDINVVLPRLKNGDLKKGLLGVTMQGTDQFGVEAKIGTVQPGSAAATIKLQAGDVITEVDGKAVRNYAQLLHQLGKKYDGDSIDLKAKRGANELVFKGVKLGGTAAAFGPVQLGILPMRDDADPGVEIRFVYPKSPADTAGLKAGDRITKLGPTNPPNAPLQQLAGRDALAAALAGAQPNTEIKLEYTPKGEKTAKTVTIKVADMTTDIPEKLPEKASLEKALAPKKPVGPMPPVPMPPKDKKEDDKKDEKKDDEKKDDKKDEKKDEKKKVETGLFERMNNARDHGYWVFVHEDYDPNIAHALLIWLHPVGKNKERDFKIVRDLWEDFCKDNHIILVMPKAEGENGWIPSETDFVQEAARTIMEQYTVDRRRVVVHGMGVGGQMALYMGFHNRDLIRGVASIGAVHNATPKERVPNQPLAFFIAVGEKDPLKEAVKETNKKIGEGKYPTFYRELKEKGHQYFEDEGDSFDAFKQLIRWINSLDRL